MNRRGFSLVELLTVVGIVAVLTGIAIPTFNAVRGRARHASCAENLHQLGAGLTLYANDHEGWLPPATTEEFVWSKVPGVAPEALAASPKVLRVATEPYLKGDSLWFCPADPQSHRNDLWLGQRHLLTSYRFDPKAPGQLSSWPPRMQLMRDPIPNSLKMERDVPLLCDAVGLPSTDSDPRFRETDEARSNHPDALVNAVGHDLSLSRVPAKAWVGSAR